MSGNLRCCLAAHGVPANQDWEEGVIIFLCGVGDGPAQRSESAWLIRAVKMP
jgi:hypothetical protein